MNAQANINLVWVGQKGTIKRIKLQRMFYRTKTFLHNMIRYVAARNNTVKNIFPAILCLMASCAQLQKLQEPVTGCLRRGSIISIDIPPITLTPARTAEERQLIGENREIEKDGWLVASNLSKSRTSSDYAGENEEKKRLRREEGVLIFFKQNLEEFKSLEILGESTDGFLYIVPAHLRTKKIRNNDEEYRALKAMEMINRSRKWIYEYIERNEGKESATARRESYVRTANTGQWILSGNWKRL